MAKKKTSTDVSVTTFEILHDATGEPTETNSRNGKPTKKKDQPEKNPAAVALGRLGGLKGGKAKAAKELKKQRAQIARKAAKVRCNLSPK